MKLISWNINKRKEAWQYLLDADADIALLQEATQPPPNVAPQIDIDEEPWLTYGKAIRPWRTAIVRLNDNISINWLTPKSLEQADNNHFAVSVRGPPTTIRI